MLRELLSILIMPFTFTLIAVLIGALLYWRLDRQKTGLALMIAGTALLLLFSSRPGAYMLLYPLEQCYEQLSHPPASPAPYVVVLSGGSNPDERLTATAKLGQSSTKRLIEGIRVHRMLPDSELILMGGIRGGSTPT